MGVSQNWEYLFRGHNKKCGILGSILGSPCFGKLPERCLYREVLLGL